MAPGMTIPGRSIVGAFVNTTAVLWFWCYVLFELYWNWDLMCESEIRDASLAAGTLLKWLDFLLPSPVHWLILLFAVAGLSLTLCHFISDMFTAPVAPPRSRYELHKWKMRRQLHVCKNVCFFVLLCIWGGLLFYFTHTQQRCASSSPSVHRLALLLLLIFFVVLGVVCLLLFCVSVDCCFSGRMRFVLLLSEDVMDIKLPPEHHNSLTSGGGFFGKASEHSSPHVVSEV